MALLTHGAASCYDDDVDGDDVDAVDEDDEIADDVDADVDDAPADDDVDVEDVDAVDDDEVNADDVYVDADDFDEVNADDADDDDVELGSVPHYVLLFRGESAGGTCPGSGVQAGSGSGLQHRGVFTSSGSFVLFNSTLEFYAHFLFHITNANDALTLFHHWRYETDSECLERYHPRPPSK
ncbi:hypothetical protein NDU88_000172 [Pleurodeles waltl]|uniref:Uncharacterized protein n=1 Tax=Pleurodeles waltl TaxID=8319 RepID=A0AAV7WI77_PLEWA|nr:hypothetical protein NDU88_000172 [Pleurodeles waltl]